MSSTLSSESLSRIHAHRSSHRTAKRPSTARASNHLSSPARIHRLHRSSESPPPSSLPDAISTSSSTLVNLDSDAGRTPSYLYDSSDSHSSSEGPPLDFLRQSVPASDGGTEGTETPPRSRQRPSVSSAASSSHRQQSSTKSPSPRRVAYIRVGTEEEVPVPDSQRRQDRGGRARQKCPVDCRCSDQDIEFGTVCRRALGSSTSSASDHSGGAARTERRRQDSQRRNSLEPSRRASLPKDQLASSHMYSESKGRSPSRELRSHEWSGRDLRKDPVLVPKGSPGRAGLSRLTAQSSPGVGRNRPDAGGGSNDRPSSFSGSDSDDIEQHLSSRSRLLARWARRPDRRELDAASASESSDQEAGDNGAGPAAALGPLASPAVGQSGGVPRAPSHRADEHPLDALDASGRGSASFAASRTTPLLDRKTLGGRATPQSAPPTQPAAARRSIAAVFEKMQQEREERQKAEQRAKDEKRLKRERERAARAFGWEQQRRRAEPADDVAAGPATDEDGSGGEIELQGSSDSFSRSAARLSGASSVLPSIASGSPARAESKPDSSTSASVTPSANGDLSNGSSSARARALARVRNARLKRLSGGSASFDRTPVEPLSLDNLGGPSVPQPALQSPQRRAIEDSSSSDEDSQSEHARQGTDAGDLNASYRQQAAIEGVEEGAKSFDRARSPMPAKSGLRQLNLEHDGDTEEDETEDLQEALDQVISRSRHSESPFSGRQSGALSSFSTTTPPSLVLRPPSRSPQLDADFAFPASRSPSTASPAASPRGASLSSSPATSPRQAVHRRQRSTVVSLSRNLPGSPAAAAHALRHVLGGPDPHVSMPGSQSQLVKDAERDDTTRTLEDDEGLDRERRRRSVRFSPQPDYRSDSGSQQGSDGDGDGSPDETAMGAATSSAGGSGGGLRVVNRHHLDTPPSPDPNTEGEDAVQPASQISLAPVERALQLEQESHSRLGVTGEEQRDSAAGASSGNGNFSMSMSMHLPGGYVSTPSRERGPRRSGGGGFERGGARGDAAPASAPADAAHGSLQAANGPRQQPPFNAAAHSPPPPPPPYAPSFESTHHRPSASNLTSNSASLNGRPTSPPLPATASLQSPSSPSSPARIMSPAQRRKLAASRAQSASQGGTSHSGTATPPVIEEEEDEPAGSISLVAAHANASASVSASVDDSSFLSAAARSGRRDAYRLSPAPLESTPPRMPGAGLIRNRAPNGGSRLSTPAGSSRSTSPSGLARAPSTAAPQLKGLFGEASEGTTASAATGVDEDDSVRITMKQIVSALKQREAEDAAVHAGAGGLGDATRAREVAASRIKAAIDEVAASLPPPAPVSQSDGRASATGEASSLSLPPATEEERLASLGRITSLRGRLAALVASLGGKLSLVSASASGGEVTSFRHPPRPFYRNARVVLSLVILHLALCWGMLAASHKRAEHLFYSAYFDPAYPDLYALNTGANLFPSRSLFFSSFPAPSSSSSLSSSGMEQGRWTTAAPPLLVATVHGVLAALLLPLQVLSFLAHPLADLVTSDADYFVPT